MNKDHPHLVVVGGGISGLAAAYRLQNRFSETSAKVTLLEASPRLGGVIQTVRREGCLIETGPDCFISEKPRGLGLCQELGLKSELIGTNPEFRRSFVVRRERLYPVPEGFYLMGPARLSAFLASPLLSWRGKIRAMVEPFIPRRPSPDESLGSFVRRRFGREMLDRMAQPLVSGIYAADPDQLSLPATFPQFLEMEKRAGSVIRALRKRSHPAAQASGARYSLFMTLRSGLETLIRKLADSIAAEIKTSCAVSRITSQPGNRWKLDLQDGKTLIADALCLALPAWASAALMKEVDSHLSLDLQGIPYGNASTLTLAFRESDIRHPLKGCGFVSPRIENCSVPACTFLHRKFEGRAPAGLALLRVFAGETSSLSRETEPVLMEKVLRDLNALLGLNGKPLFHVLKRYSRALPQYTLGHLARLTRIEAAMAAWPTLSLAGNWARGVGIPDSIDCGEKAADRLYEALVKQPAESIA